MNNSTTVIPQTQSLNNRIVTVVVTFSLALIMLSAVGFVQGNNGTIHDAAHDTRHSMSFPCH